MLGLNAAYSSRISPELIQSLIEVGNFQYLRNIKSCGYILTIGNNK